MILFKANKGRLVQHLHFFMDSLKQQMLSRNHIEEKRKDVQTVVSRLVPTVVGIAWLLSKMKCLSENQ